MNYPFFSKQLGTAYIIPIRTIWENDNPIDSFSIDKSKNLHCSVPKTDNPDSVVHQCF